MSKPENKYTQDGSKEPPRDRPTNEEQNSTEYEDCDPEEIDEHDPLPVEECPSLLFVNPGPYLLHDSSSC